MHETCCSFRASFKERRQEFLSCHDHRHHYQSEQPVFAASYKKHALHACHFHGWKSCLPNEIHAWTGNPSQWLKRENGINVRLLQDKKRMKKLLSPEPLQVWLHRYHYYYSKGLRWKNAYPSWIFTQMKQEKRRDRDLLRDHLRHDMKKPYNNEDFEKSLSLILWLLCFPCDSHLLCQRSRLNIRVYERNLSHGMKHSHTTSPLLFTESSSSLASVSFPVIIITGGNIEGMSGISFQQWWW